MELNRYSLHMPSWREEGETSYVLHSSIFVSVCTVTFAGEIPQPVKLNIPLGI
jgi:hypothetical protein